MILSTAPETGARVFGRQTAMARSACGAVALAAVALTSITLMSIGPAEAQQPAAPQPAQTAPPAAVPRAPQAAPATPVVPQADIAGLWVDHTGRGAVEIVPCGTAGKLCGYIVWLKSTVDERGQPLIDHKNPDARKRKQPICGVQVLGELARVGQGSAGAVWGSGWIYDPEEGQNFDVEVKLLGPDRLSVMGYAGLKFLSETYVWKRAPAATAAARCAPSRV